MALKEYPTPQLFLPFVQALVHRNLRGTHSYYLPVTTVIYINSLAMFLC